MARKSLVALIVTAIVLPAARAEAQTAVAGRHRIDVKAGAVRSSVFGAVEFAHYFTERVSMFVAAEGVQSGPGTTAGPEGFGTVSYAAIPIGIRWNPIRSQNVPAGVRPYITTAFVSVISSKGGPIGGGATAGPGANVSATAGAQLGGGVDFQISRRIVIGAGAAYNWLAPFDGPGRSSRHLSGPEVSVGFGFLFGSGYGGPRPQ